MCNQEHQHAQMPRIMLTNISLTLHPNSQLPVSHFRIAVTAAAVMVDAACLGGARLAPPKHPASAVTALAATAIQKWETDSWKLG